MFPDRDKDFIYGELWIERLDHEKIYIKYNIFIFDSYYKQHRRLSKKIKKKKLFVHLTPPMVGYELEMRARIKNNLY